MSVTEPITPALRRVKALLFAPFDLRKWFVIGFCAWLSSCGESGGGGGGGGGGGNRGAGSIDRQDIRRALERAWEYVMENLGWIVPLTILVLVVVVALWLVSVWLNSRGKFMFLHCVALNRAEIQVPWDRYATHAHSLFLFQAVLGALGFLTVFPIVVGGLVLLLLAVAGEGPLAGPIALFIFAVLCAVGIGIVWAIVRKFLVDFVVPLMYLRTASVRAAWGEFIPLARANMGRFALYLLFSVVLAMVIGTLILLVVIATCCIAGCLMAIPYLGTVLLLPVFVFKRAYALYYLEQYGPEFTVIERDEAVPPVPAGHQPV